MRHLEFFLYLDQIKQAVVISLITAFDESNNNKGKLMPC